MGYVNGALQFSFNDSSQRAVFSGSGNIVHILRDQGNQGVPGKNPSGFIDFVRIYGGPPNATEVATLSEGVPDPATWMLLASGCFLLAKARRRFAAHTP